MLKFDRSHFRQWHQEPVRNRRGDYIFYLTSLGLFLLLCLYTLLEWQGTFDKIKSPYRKVKIGTLESNCPALQNVGFEKTTAPLLFLPSNRCLDLSNCDSAYILDNDKYQITVCLDRGGKIVEKSFTHKRHYEMELQDISCKAMLDFVLDK